MGTIFPQVEFNAVHHPTYITDPEYAQRAGFEQSVWDRSAEHWQFPYWDPRQEEWNTWHRKWGHLG